MASLPTLSLKLRASINRNLNEIVELHDELLGELHRVIPHSEYTQPISAKSTLPTPPNGHHRWRSLDAVPEDKSHDWLQKIPGMTAEPKVAAEVAKVFGKKVCFDERRNLTFNRAYKDYTRSIVFSYTKNTVPNTNL
jgi:hypothetical protein